MKLGVLQFFSWSRRVPLADVYARAFERIAIMEETGYDCVWLAEHHFNAYSVCPSVHVMAAHVAARTRNLRIGMAVSLAALYHPLRLAEEVALVDVLSGGRVNWGAGRGFDRAEFAAFGVPVEESAERMLEAVEIVRAAWTNERLDHRGKYHSFEGVEVLPKPAQQPHPPLWLATTSDDAVRRAAERGYDMLQDPHSSHAELIRKRKLYFEALHANGHATEGREIPTARLLAIAPTDAEAREVAASGAAWTFSSYANPTNRPANSPLATPPGVDPVERYLSDVVIHGSPERVLDRIQELRETLGLDSLMCAPLSQRTFSLFTEQVLPKLV